MGNLIMVTKDTCDVVERMERFDQAARGAYSVNTERAIRSDWKFFADFCAEIFQSPLPAKPETVAGFIDTIAAKSKPASIRRYMASIAFAHLAAGLVSPTTGQVVRLAMRRVAREQGTRQTQATPAKRQDILRMRAVSTESIRDIRDMAMVGLAYDTLCRRSELVALDVADMTLAEDGTGTVLIRRSKTDQVGQGSVRFVAQDTVRLVQAWVSVAKIHSGPLFVGIDIHDRISPDRLSDKGYYRAIKRFGDRAQVGSLSGHSCRVGAAQDLVAAGIALAEVMQAGGWRSPQMVARYSEHQGARQGAMAKLAKLQTR